MLKGISLTNNPDYYQSLSEASKNTLIYQGGKMSEKEASQFENQPWFEYSIQAAKMG